MQYNNLRREAVKEIKKRYPIKDIKTKAGLVKFLTHHGKQYKGTVEQQRAKFNKYLTNRMNKDIEEMLYNISLIEQADKFDRRLVITLEWKRSYQWGSNPTASTNYGFSGSSIGGCGYCKTSTATAQALNSHLPLMQLLYKLKNKELRNRKDSYIDQNGHNNTTEQGFNHHLFGYGSGYGVLPHFEGGVGISSHCRIIQKIGLKWHDITNTKRTDVFMISK
ncbi:MAG: hypothetical protein V3W20_00570 [Candidatus Neomarinimicrobiota bacterium]